MISARTFFAKATRDEFLAKALELAKLVGLPVTSWRTGDPTHTIVYHQAEHMASVDELASDMAAASHLRGGGPSNWLTIRASDTFNVDRGEATTATPSVTLDNTGGGLYEIAPGGLICSASSTNKTYANQSTVTIEPLQTGVVVSLEAQEEGSGSSVLADDVDTINSPTLTGVSIVSSTASTATDEQTDEALIQACTDSNALLTQSGPSDVYSAVVRDESRTGLAGITRSFTDGDYTDGTCIVYAAYDAAVPSAGDVAAMQKAVDLWAAPIGFHPTVVAGTQIDLAIQCEANPLPGGAVLTEDEKTALETAVGEYLVSVQMGGTPGAGVVATSGLKAAMHAAVPSLISMNIYNPAADYILNDGEFPVAVSFDYNDS